MAIGDFTIFTEVNIVVALVNTDVIAGNESMHFTNSSAGLARGFVHRTENVSPPPSILAVTRGRLRLLHRYPSTGNSGFPGSNGFQGICCQMSNVSALDTSADFYAFGVNNVNARLELRKYTSGITSSATALDTSDTTVLALDTNYAMELEWRAEPLELSAVRLICRHGEVTNPLDPFDNMTEIYNHDDITSPFFTTLAEGIVSNNQAPGISRRWLVDTSSAFRLDPV